MGKISRRFTAPEMAPAWRRDQGIDDDHGLVRHRGLQWGSSVLIHSLVCSAKRPAGGKLNRDKAVQADTG